jgi:hypothetical protein
LSFPSHPVAWFRSILLPMTAQVFPFFFSPASTNFFSFPRLRPVSRWLTVLRLQLPVNLQREQQHKQLRPGNAFPPPLPGCFCAPTKLVGSCGLLAPQTTTAGRLASTQFSCRQSSPEQPVGPQHCHQIQCFGPIGIISKVVTRTSLLCLCP